MFYVYYLTLREENKKIYPYITHTYIKKYPKIYLGEFSNVQAARKFALENNYILLSKAGKWIFSNKGIKMFFPEIVL